MILLPNMVFIITVWSLPNSFWSQEDITERGRYLLRARPILDFHTRGGGLAAIINVYTDMRLEGVYFSGFQVYEWVWHADSGRLLLRTLLFFFYIKSIPMGYLFHPKGIWMGKISKIVYEWV